MMEAKSIFRFFSIHIVALASAGWLAGCEQSEDGKIATAQKCLDSASTAAEASGCVALVDGINSNKASRIRCSGTYLQRDFTSTKFKTVFQQLKANNGNNPATNMVSTLAFVGTSSVTGRTNTADANYVVSECTSSGSPGMTMLSGITKISTVMGNILGATDPSSQLDLNQLKNQFQNLANGSNDSAAAQVGSAAIAAQSSYCATSTAANQDICKSLNSAVQAGGSDPTAVGRQLANLLK